MNLDRCQKIKGGFHEALKLMENDVTVYDEYGRGYVLGAFRQLRFVDSKGELMESHSRFNELLNRDWYIPKPFDVRQAMLDRPNEWVGAYKNFEGKWFKVGFDTASMNAVVEQIEWDGNPFWQHGRARPSVLNECIPIEDVPEEATR